MICTYFDRYLLTPKLCFGFVLTLDVTAELHSVSDPVRIGGVMRASQNFRQRPNVFISAKAATAIPIAHELVRDALVQASLDPTVRSIEFIPTVAAFGDIIALNAIVLRGDAGSKVLDIVETRPLRSIDDEGLVLLAFDHLGLTAHTITAADLRRQPKAANSSLVWSCRYTRVPASDRVRVLQALGEDGPMPLAGLSAEVRWSVDPVAGVLALACLDLVELDLASIPLGPETVVRRRTPEGDAR